MFQKRRTGKAVKTHRLAVLLQGTLQQFVDDFFRSVLCSNSVVPPAVKYFFDFLDEQALKHDNVDEETLHIWKTNRWDFLRRGPAPTAGLERCVFSKSAVRVEAFRLKPETLLLVSSACL